MEYVKYPRTPHLPWSRGATEDDIALDDECLWHLRIISDDIIVTEKLDGECTVMYYDKIHARSIDSKSHPSRDFVKKIHSEICYKIPPNIRICGENVFAKHSIQYSKLTSYFYVFAIFEENRCLSWDDIEIYCKELGLETVPVLYRGPWDESEIKKCWTGISKFGGEQEGYVVRNVESFSSDWYNWNRNIAKYVRSNHVQTDEHWLDRWYKEKDKNKLINHLEERKCLKKEKYP